MFRHFNVEAFVFWWLNSVMAIFALLWVAKKIADFWSTATSSGKSWISLGYRPSELFISTARLVT